MDKQYHTIVALAANFDTELDEFLSQLMEDARASAVVSVPIPIVCNSNIWLTAMVTY